jgi:hypothetical protein
MITSETCDRCGITYEAHFDHPQRCPEWTTDEVDRQAAQEPARSSEKLRHTDGTVGKCPTSHPLYQIRS